MSASNFELNSTKNSFGSVQLTKYDDKIAVTLHGNLVALVNYRTETVQLSNCGWVTPTTHRVINKVLEQLGLLIRVYGVKGKTMYRIDAGHDLEVLVNGDSFRFYK